MAGGLKYGPSRNSGGLLASTVVLVVGALGGAFVLLSQFPNRPEIAALALAGAALLIFAMIWSLQDRPPSSLRENFCWLTRKRNVLPDMDYRPQVIKQDDVRYGTNAPPTVEEVRELKDSDRTWVPSNVSGRRRTIRGR